MDFSQVKLVVSDMDGTLLNSNHEVSSEFISLFEQLKKHKITFVAASGRQYPSMVEKLHMMRNDIYIIAENGGVTKYRDQVLDTESLDTKYLKEIIPILRKVENVLIILCAKDKAYIDTKDEELINYFKQYYTEFEIVNDLLELQDLEVFKIAVRHPVSSEHYILPFISELHKHSEIDLKISGLHWLDISSIHTNKGNALAKLQKYLGVLEDETMVFGDFNNDIEMLQKAYFSFAMENAHPNVKNTARFSTRSNDDNGVEYILKKVITSKN